MKLRKLFFPFKTFQHASLVILTTTCHLIYIKCHFKTSSHSWNSHISQKTSTVVDLLANFLGLVLNCFQVTQGATPEGIAFPQMRHHLHTSSLPTCCQETSREGQYQRTGVLPTLCLSSFPPKIALLHSNPINKNLWTNQPKPKTHLSELKEMEEKQPSKSYEIFGLQGLFFFCLSKTGRTNMYCISTMNCRGLLQVREQRCV